ncbi:MAG TPA: hypothetical protein VFY95_05535 [Sphingomicrobium sp.]
MRIQSILAPLLLCASPALAQAPAAAAPQAPDEMQRVLADPAMADRLDNMMQALSKAVLDLPVGDVQAAVEGRKPTAAERRLTVRDLGRRDDPNFDRDLQRRIADTKPMIQAGMKAVSEALPAIVRSMDEAGKALERAAANMPDPTYPKR